VTQELSPAPAASDGNLRRESDQHTAATPWTDLPSSLASSRQNAEQKRLGEGGFAQTVSNSMRDQTVKLAAVGGPVGASSLMGTAHHTLEIRIPLMAGLGEHALPAEIQVSCTHLNRLWITLVKS
jgi:hypothetical protein